MHLRQSASTQHQDLQAGSDQHTRPWGLSVFRKAVVSRRLCVLGRLLLALDADLADTAAQQKVGSVGELARRMARGDEPGGAVGRGGLLAAADLRWGNGATGQRSASRRC